MKIYLINLDRAADRRAHMLKELARLAPQIPVERAMCVDIKAADWAAPASVKPGHWRSDRWSLGPSDIEIFRSHIDCWERIAASGEMGVILEDDLIFSDRFTAALSELEKAKIEGIIRLDGIGHLLILGKPEYQLNDFTVSPIMSPTASAAAYAIDAKTAAYLASTAKVERTVDDYLFDPTPADRGARGHGQRILQLEPVVTLQAQFGSYADDTRDIPPFLTATKRVDVKSRRARAYLGPLPYRLRKEVLRAIYRRRLAQRIESATAAGGRWATADLCPQLRWD